MWAEQSIRTNLTEIMLRVKAVGLDDAGVVVVPDAAIAEVGGREGIDEMGDWIEENGTEDGVAMEGREEEEDIEDPTSRSDDADPVVDAKLLRDEPSEIESDSVEAVVAGSRPLVKVGSTFGRLPELVVVAANGTGATKAGLGSRNCCIRCRQAFPAIATTVIGVHPAGNEACEPKLA